MTACLLSYVHRIKKKATREVGGEKGIIKGEVDKEGYFLSKCIVHTCQNVMMKAITFYN